MASNEIGSATFGLVVGLGRFKRELDEAEREAGQSGDKTGKKFTDGATDEVEGSGQRWSQAISALTPAVIAGGVALGGAAVIGLMDGLEREAAGDRLAAQLGLDPDDAERAAQVAGDVYAGAWGDSLGEVHDAVGAVLASLTPDRSFAGDTGEIEDWTIKALDLASAFDQDVNRAISSVGIMLRSGLVDDADHAFDLLTTGMQQMPAHLRDELFEATDEYGQFFATLGFEGEEAFGLLVDASRDGMFGIDKTGDALKEFTIRATDMSSGTEEAYDDMGLGMEEMTNRILAGGDEAKGAFDEIVDALLGMEDPGEQAAAAVALFGTPIEDLNVSDIPNFLGQLDTMSTRFGDVEGAADDMGDTLNDNARTEIEAFKRQALQGLGEFAVEYAIPAIRTLAAFVREDLMPAVSRVSDWARENTPIVIGIATAIGVPLVAAFGAWAVAAGVAAAATIAATWPLLAVGAAIGVLVYLVITHWDTISRVTEATFSAVIGFVSGAWNWISDHWPLLLGIITGPIGTAVGILATHWETIRNGVTGVKDWIVERFGDVVDFFTELPGKISGAAGNMWSWIGDTLRSTLVRVAGLWNNFRFPSWTMPSVNIPGVGSIGGSTIGGWGLPHINVPRLAAGGTVEVGGLALVGERGPELLRLPSGAEVSPLDRTRGAGRGGDGEVIQLFLDGRLLAEYVTDYQADLRARNGRARRVA
ncbi:MAG: hypothetical protein U5R31_03005 [Acidimicrobiia bacterium]|nr:hypothetical protein [Acidimicrobiia bacterium]